MASTSDIRNGMCLQHKGDVYSVVEFLHVKPGKGPAFVRTKIKSLTTGKVLDNTWPAGHKIDEVRVERRTFQYLYNDDMGYHFMNNETFEQVRIQKEMIDHPNLLQEGAQVEILFHAEKEIPLTLDMPQYIIAEITYTEPGVKGDTATNAKKPATIDTGAEIMVPLFINEGDKIKVDTKTASYVERVKQ
jgi:elongation factor P